MKANKKRGHRPVSLTNLFPRYIYKLTCIKEISAGGTHNILFAHDYYKHYVRGMQAVFPVFTLISGISICYFRDQKPGLPKQNHHAADQYLHMPAYICPLPASASRSSLLEEGS